MHLAEHTRDKALAETALPQIETGNPRALLGTRRVPLVTNRRPGESVDVINERP